MDLGMHGFGMYGKQLEKMLNTLGFFVCLLVFFFFFFFNTDFSTYDDHPEMQSSFLNHFLYFEAKLSPDFSLHIPIFCSKRLCEGGTTDEGKYQTTCVLIPDIYFCLFSLCSGLHGSNFYCDETEQQSLWSSLQGESQCPPPLLPGQEGFGGPRGMG